MRKCFIIALLQHTIHALMLNLWTYKRYDMSLAYKGTHPGLEVALATVIHQIMSATELWSKMEVCFTQ